MTNDKLKVINKLKNLKKKTCENIIWNFIIPYPPSKAVRFHMFEKKIN